MSDPTLDEAYAEGRADQADDDREMLAWAYTKLMHISWTKQEDALMLDRINLTLQRREP